MKCLATCILPRPLFLVKTKSHSVSSAFFDLIGHRFDIDEADQHKLVILTTQQSGAQWEAAEQH